MKITKAEMVRTLIDEAVNPDWKGKKAEQERINWEKELKKKTRAELKADYDSAMEAVNARALGRNIW